MMLARGNEPRILLLGASGQVGWELQRCLMTLGEVIAIGRNTEPLSVDLADLDAVRRVVRELSPQWIVNAAAYTAVDRAEAEPHEAMRINGLAPGVLAEEAKRAGATLVYYSTDYVFDGDSSAPYTEDDKPHPLNVYGRTKLAGERAIQAVGGAYFIFRTSWVYGLRGQNFLLTIRRLAHERDELRIVEDQIGAPTWCRHIAQATAQVMFQIQRQPGRLADTVGLYHLTASGRTSWYGFARASVTALQAHEPLAVKRVLPIATADYPCPAERPKNSLLDNSRIERTFGIHRPAWDEALSLCLAGKS